MKKLLSILLIACMCLSMTVVLASCEHEHTWDEGVITTEATQNADGVKTFTCTDCGEKKTEAVEFEGLSAEKWATMLSADTFANYTLTESQTVNYGEVAMKQDSVFKVTADKAQVDMTVDGQHLGGMTYLGTEAEEQKASFQAVFLALLEESDNFVYDKAEKIYNVPNEFSLNIDMETYQITVELTIKNGKVQVSDDGKLSKFECDFTQKTTTPEGPVTATVDAVWTFSDYGTTVINDADVY